MAMSAFTETTGGSLVGSRLPRKRIKASPFVTRYPIKGFPTVQDAGRWLADQWSQMEARYGRAAAIGMVATMLATMPLPGNVAAVIAAAEAARGLHGVLAGKAVGEYRVKSRTVKRWDVVLSYYMPGKPTEEEIVGSVIAKTVQEAERLAQEEYGHLARGKGANVHARLPGGQREVKSSPFRSRPPLGKSLTPDAVAKMLEK